MKSILGCNKSAKTIVSVAFKLESKEKVRQKQELQLPCELNSQGFVKCVSLTLICIPEHLMFVLVPGNCIKSQKSKKISFHSPGLLQSRSCCPVMLITTECTIDPRHLSKWLFFRALHKPLVSFMWSKKSHHMMTNSWLCDEWLSAIKEVASNHRLLARLLGFALSSKVQSKIC